MSIDITLPNIGEGVSEADLAEVLVSVGDAVEAEQVLMEFETEKAVVEMPCPQAGKIEEILVKPGDTVQVGQVVVRLAGSPAAESDKPQADKPDEKTLANSAASEESQPKTAEQPPEKKQPATKTEMVTGSVDFQLPPLGEGVESADVAEIMVSEGDTIEAGQIVMELETEKAVVELPCEHAGKITKLHVGEGDTVPVGAVVLTIEASTAVEAPQESAPQATSEPPREASSDVPKSTRSGVEKPTRSGVEKASRQTTMAVASDANGHETPVPAAPSTRRLARQLGVDLRQISGSESGGRITAEDVQAYVRNQLSGKQLSRPAAGSMAISGGGIQPPPLPDFSRYGIVEREKMNKLSRTAAENLTVSWNVIPHVTHHDVVDITELEAARKRFGQGVGKNGPKVTMTAIVMKALATCLQHYPKFNSSLDPETFELVYKRYYNIGCAVDTPNGLVVPVVKDCDSKSILEIAADITDLAVRARDRKLTMEEMHGATCTVTNLGGIGGVGFTPIVNYPEVCILGMSRGQQELKMIDGQVQERLMLPLSLSYDHRVVNGADAARFVVALTNLLGDPFQLMTTV